MAARRPLRGPSVRDRLPLLAFALALLVGALVVIFLRAGARGEFAEPLSTYRSEPDGARALFLLAQEVGLPVERRHLNLESIEGEPELVLLGVEGDAPESEEATDAGEAHDSWWHERLTQYETEEVLRKVEAGATLIYAVTRQHPFLSELHVTFTPATDHASRQLVPLSPTPFSRGVKTVQTRVSGYVEADGALPLLIDPHYDLMPAAILLQRGQGRILVTSATTMAANRELGQDDNAAFWLNALTELAPAHGPIAFDEFHHGFTGDRTVMAYARKFGLHWAIVQGLFALALWILALRRLGPPQALAEVERRASADYLLAMARIYRLGKHRRHAAEALVRGAVRALQSHAALPRAAAPEQVADALAAQGRPDLAEGLRQLQARVRRDLDEAELLALARAAAALRAHIRTPHPGENAA
jgi:hypothetical protein